MSKPFQFKEFTVTQDQCAMKIGTDGVLLGAWVEPKEMPFNILDIGTGTGVIALMMAQRFSSSDVDAIEIDAAAYEQAMTNFENSPWADRMFCYHASFQEFFQEMEESYDLIVSNPPFFTATQKSPNEQRNKARFEDALPFEHLLYGASKLLSDQGTFALIVPYDQEEQIVNIAAKMHLRPIKITHVKGNEQALIKRSLIAFKFNVTKKDLQLTELIIEKERHIYTDDYIKLVQNFYLKM